MSKRDPSAIADDLLDMSTTLKRTAEKLMKGEGKEASEGKWFSTVLCETIYSSLCTIHTAIVKRADAIRKGKKLLTQKSAPSQ